MFKWFNKPLKPENFKIDRWINIKTGEIITTLTHFRETDGRTECDVRFVKNGLNFV